MVYKCTDSLQAAQADSASSFSKGMPLPVAVIVVTIRHRRVVWVSLRVRLHERRHSPLCVHAQGSHSTHSRSFS